MSSTPLDDHGQPLNRAFNHRRRIERDISELLGMAKGIVADGVVNDAEAKFLARWGETHQEALAQWPTNLIFSRLNQYLADGRIDEIERVSLRELLEGLVGGTTTLLLGYEGASSLPLDTPPPLICWGPDEVYVFTGRFAYGPRRACEREVHERGARCEATVTRRTTFMVLGTFGSTDWLHSSYGTKIKRAVELRASQFPIRIVGEDHWAAAL
jgi:NAD-dependent DNA ligase